MNRGIYEDIYTYRVSQSPAQFDIRYSHSFLVPKKSHELRFSPGAGAPGMDMLLRELIALSPTKKCQKIMEKNGDFMWHSPAWRMPHERLATATQGWRMLHERLASAT